MSVPSRNGPLISILIGSTSLTTSSSSSRVGRGVPAKTGENFPPKSYALSCSTVISWIFPWPLEVRAISSSWQTTKRPSRVRWMSVSIPSAFCSRARRNAGRVFSGAYAEAPRWAWMIGIKRGLLSSLFPDYTAPAGKRQTFLRGFCPLFSLHRCNIPPLYCIL